MASSNEASPDERRELLFARRLPAIVNAEKAAVLLGRLPHDVTTLVARKLLKPLGKPTRNAPKYFSTYQLEQLARDEKRLSDVVECLSAHWQEKKERRKR